MVAYLAAAKTAISIGFSVYDFIQKQEDDSAAKFDELIKKVNELAALGENIRNDIRSLGSRIGDLTTKLDANVLAAIKAEAGTALDLLADHRADPTLNVGDDAVAASTRAVNQILQYMQNNTADRGLAAGAIVYVASVHLRLIQEMKDGAFAAANSKQQILDLANALDQAARSLYDEAVKQDRFGIHFKDNPLPHQHEWFIDRFDSADQFSSSYFNGYYSYAEAHYALDNQAIILLPPFRPGNEGLWEDAYARSQIAELQVLANRWKALANSVVKSGTLADETLIAQEQTIQLATDPSVLSPPVAALAESMAHIKKVYSLVLGHQIDGKGGNDLIVGGTRNDVLYGGDGNDILKGGFGDDHLEGGAGDDWLYGGNGRFDKAAEVTDIYSRLVNAGAGSDTLDGGEGIDWVSYADIDTYITESFTAETGLVAGQGVTVDLLKTGFQDTGGGGVDKLIGIENVEGSRFADSLTGDGKVNELRGLDGTDTLDGGGGDDILDGGAGIDTLKGGLGIDTASYATSAQAVRVSLVTGREYSLGSDGYVAGTALDTLIDIESLAGSNFGDLLEGNAAANVLSGLGGNDTMNAGAGNDAVFGGAGDDTVDGGDGDDQIDGDVATDASIDGADVLGGGIGDDRFLRVSAGAGVDRMTGGVGRDTYHLAFKEGAAADVVTDFKGGINGDILDFSALRELERSSGFGGQEPRFKILQEDYDTVLYRQTDSGAAYQRVLVLENTLTTSLLRENLAFVSNFVPITMPSGTNGNDVYTGNANRNSYLGLAGDDRLDGRGGLDLMAGGLGNDVFTVDDAGDVVFETAGEGADAIYTSVSYALRFGQEIESLVISNAKLTAKVNLTGNEFANLLIANAGNNILDGGGGADDLRGLAGNDTYMVDHDHDWVREKADGGTDTVLASVDHVLAANVENLTLTGETARRGTGNELANVLTGNGAANVLDGAAAADTMIGLGGDDIYYVDDLLDKVIEGANAGVDSVISSVNFTLGDNVENLTLTGGAIEARGNALANVLTGNAGNNAIVGGDGADVMRGLGGDDTYYVDNAGDQVFETAGGGNDTILTLASFALHADQHVETLAFQRPTGSTALDLTGSNTANAITGNRGNNGLVGRAGDDVIDGDWGDDTIYGDDVADTAADGVDLLIGGRGDDTFGRVAAGAGVDTIYGGIGRDTYRLSARDGSAADVVMDFTVGPGGDILDFSDMPEAGLGFVGGPLRFVQSGADTLLQRMTDDGSGYATFLLLKNVVAANIGPDNLANVTIIPAGALQGTAGNNTFVGTDGSDAYYGLAGNDDIAGGEGVDNLFGGEGNDRLDGGAGADTMNGSVGNDTYIVDDAGDVVTDRGLSSDNDTVITTVGWTLGAGERVETLRFTETAAAGQTLRGNEFANTLVASGLGSILHGGDGNDRLYGLGSSTLVGDGGNDRIDGGVGDDVIYGDSITDGVDGKDLLIGGDGNDTFERLSTGAGLDTVWGGAGRDTFRVMPIQHPGAGMFVIPTPDRIGDFKAGPRGDILDLSAVNGLKFFTQDGANVVVNAAFSVWSPNGTSTENHPILVLENVRLDNLFAENLVGYFHQLSTAFRGDNDQDQLFGNEHNNAMAGFGGADYLHGGSGNDDLFGGAGNDALYGTDNGSRDELYGEADDDTYYVDAADIVFEAAGEGFDTVIVQQWSMSDPIAHTLAAGQEVEVLQASGSGLISLTGNDLDNTIIGADGRNILVGGGGADRLVDAQASVDHRAAVRDQWGNPTYDQYGQPIMIDLATAVRSIFDGGDGIDTAVFAATGAHAGVRADLGARVAWYVGVDNWSQPVQISRTISLRNVENLAGTAVADTLLGDAAANVLIGLGGDDRIEGGAGDDTLTGDGSVAITLQQQQQGQSSYALDGADVLIGGDGNDTYKLVSDGWGVDTLTGGSGRDTFQISAPKIESNGWPSSTMFNADRVTDFTAGVNGDVIDLSAIPATWGWNEMMRPDIADFSFGLQNNSSGVTTTVSWQGHVLLVLDGRIEGFVADNFSGIVIDPDYGALRGHGGNDHLGQQPTNGGRLMIGYGGDDTYYVRHADDRVVEQTFGGDDTIVTSIDQTLAANVENLDGRYSQSGLRLAGNDRDNVIRGGSGADVITGGAGADAFVFGQPQPGFGDRVLDFTAGEDKIGLEYFWGLPAINGVLDASAFQVGARARDFDDRIIYNPNNGWVSYDSDGTGTNEAVQMVRLTAGVPLTHSDFFVL